MSDNNFARLSGLPSDIPVPNTSMMGSSGYLPPPNNSIALQGGVAMPAGSGGSGIASSLSDEVLSDRLVQVALYNQMESPPSVQNGDLSGARSAFSDIDFASQERIPYRHIVRLLRAEDAVLLATQADPQQLLDFEAFVAFLEKAYSLKNSGSS
jgi:hypothetical protein